MKITPLEIRQKSFEKVFRGYDKDEVNAYLQSLSMEWERIIEENKEWKSKIDHLQSEVDKLREVENSLFKTLKTAEDTGATLIEQAKRETELHLKQSQIEADQIISKAREKAGKMVDNAENKTKKILDEMLARVKTLEHHYHQVYDFREKLIDQLKNYAVEISERNEKFEKKGETLNVNDILTEAKRTYNETILDIEALSKNAAPDEKEIFAEEGIKEEVELDSSGNENIETLEETPGTEEIEDEEIIEDTSKEIEFEVNIPEPAVVDDPELVDTASHPEEEPEEPTETSTDKEELEQVSKKEGKTTPGSFFDEIE